VFQAVKLHMQLFKVQLFTMQFYSIVIEVYCIKFLNLLKCIKQHINFSNKRYQCYLTTSRFNCFLCIIKHLVFKNMLLC